MTTSDIETGGRYVAVEDTHLYVVERGDGYPLLVFHGGPGLDHHLFGDYLDALVDEYRLILVDQRSNGRSDRAPEDTWTLRHMAADVSSLARALDLNQCAVLGHSYGAFVVLQHAVDFPGDAAQTIVSSGIPSARYLEHVAQNLASFEPVELREHVRSSWDREKYVRTQEEVAELLHDQQPFQFADPHDPRIEEYERRTAGAIYSPDVFGSDAEVLPVFSFEEETQMFLDFRLGALGEEWRTRQTSPGELVSVLHGPCADAKRVALDPLPEMVDKDKSIGLLTIDRDDFLRVLLGEVPSGLHVISSRHLGSHKGLGQSHVA